MRLTLSSAKGTPDEKDAPAPNNTVGRASFCGLRTAISSRTVSEWLMVVPPLRLTKHSRTIHELMAVPHPLFLRKWLVFHRNSLALPRNMPGPGLGRSPRGPGL